MITIDLLVERLEAARKWTNGLVEDIEPARWFECPAPGVQHVAWQLGHLAASQVALLHMRCFGLTPSEHLPEPFIRQFGRGSKPVADPGAYPPPSEIRGHFERIHADAIIRMKSMSPDELDEPVHGDPHPMFTTKAQCMAMAAMHESFHAGQIALTRRLFGKAPLR